MSIPLRKTAFFLTIGGIALLSVAAFSNFGARAGQEDSQSSTLSALAESGSKPLIEFSVKKDSQGNPVQPDFLLPHLGTVISWNITPSENTEKEARNCWLGSDYDNRLNNHTVQSLKDELELVSIPHRNPITYTLSCSYGVENRVTSASLTIGKFVTLIPHNGSDPLPIPIGYQKDVPLMYEAEYGQPITLHWNVVSGYGGYSVSDCTLRSSDDVNPELREDIPLKASQTIRPIRERSIYRLSCLYTKEREAKRISALTIFNVKKGSADLTKQ